MLPKVSEDFVQYVWKFGLFDKVDLETNFGEKIEILKQGTQNSIHGGPDFINAKIKIGDTVWAGNVEIHLYNKNWQEHKHQENKAYNNVILHVVYYNEDVKPIILQNGRAVPTISIGHKIYQSTLQQYLKLFEGKPSFIPCENLIKDVDDFIISNFLESLLYERLERKVIDIEKDLEYAHGDLDYAFLITLFKYFGAPANKDAFELLARSFTLTQLLKQNLSKQQLESFLFGLAGLLNSKNAYALKLQNEYEYTKKLFKLKQFCKASQWKYAGVRPPNFPTVRIAQLAALLYKEPRLFSKILEIDSIKELKELFEIQVSEFWLKHYTFEKESPKISKNISESFKEKLIINVVVPFVFFYGKYINEQKYVDKALNILQDINAEQNSIITKYKTLNFNLKNASQTQAVLTLHKSYCSAKKCLECRIGYELLKAK
ncbi:MAG: DUF2851 family protein [Chitinophagales bacterium]